MKTAHGPTTAVTRRKSEPGGISLLQQRLVTEMLRDLNVGAAARRCGLSDRQARQMLEYPAVNAALQTAYRERTERVQVAADEVLRRVVRFVRADRGELSHVRMVNCRFCWGIDHRYQFTANELRVQVQQHKFQLKESNVPEDQWSEFDDQGGDGFNCWRRPYAVEHGQDHNCPECAGVGTPRLWITDYRDYSEEAKAIYAGAKLNLKTGEIQVMARDRPIGEELLMRHLGLLNERETIKSLDPELLEDESHVNVVIDAIAERLRDDPESAMKVLPPQLLEQVKG